jgi:V/A-type H+-transporting ATPase subunit K
MDPASSADILNNGLITAGAVMALAISAVGSALGTGTAGSAAIGAWKKCYAQGRPAPFTLLAFAGAPLTQTLYGLILMFVMLGRIVTPEKVQAALDAGQAAPTAVSGLAFCLVGLFAGLGICASALMQGRAAAAAADAQGETGKGFTNYLAVIGVVETVAIFVMVFALLAVF